MEYSFIADAIHIDNQLEIEYYFNFYPSTERLR